MVLIVNYHDKDYDPLRALLEGEDHFNPDWDSRENLFVKSTADPESIMLAYFNSSLVGVVYFTHDPFASFIFRLTVHPEFRGRGIATALLREAEMRLLERGASSVQTLVREDEYDSLKEFYEKRGYTPFSGRHQILTKRLSS